MVKIKYYSDPLQPATEVKEYDNVAEFLLSRFTSREELLDLRFFDGELLGHEIDQEAGHFLDINDGVIAVTHDSAIPREVATWVYVAIAVVFAVVSIALAPKIPTNIQGGKGNDQKSGTNSFGASSNEPRINQRIDDVFGTVTKHMPSLWQVPYRIGVDNEETEILLVCVGRGKYQINAANWYDGDTPVINIPNASVNVYGPGTHPGNGTPELTIGELITEEIGVYRQSNDLNPAELLPPNERDDATLLWKATGSGTTGIITLVTYPAGYDLTEFYSVGDEIAFNDCYFTKYTGSVLLYRDAEGSSRVLFDTYSEPVDIGESNTLKYEVLSVSALSITVQIPATATTPVKNAWLEMSNYNFPPSMANVYSADELLNTWIKSSTITNSEWWYKEELGDTYSPVQTVRYNYSVIVSTPYDNFIGPVFVPKKATEVIFNFVSSNGFYKLIENSEQSVYVSIQLRFIELDADNNETGIFTTSNISYGSNLIDVRRPVFKTVRTVVPYENCKIVVRRTTNRDKREGVSNADNVEWRDFYSFEPVNITDFGDVTLAHVVIPSNSRSRLIKERRQNVDVTRLITQYMGNGVFGPPGTYATDQFDQILIHNMLDPHIGRLSLENINADGFMDLRDEIISYFGSDEMCRFGYNFDSVNLTAQDIFMLICEVVMCKPYVQSGIYDAFFEKKQTVSTSQITCRNKFIGSETRKIDYDRKYDGVELTYRDNVTSVQETIYIPQNQTAVNPDRKSLEGCTSRLQAYRYAARMYNRQLYQIEAVQFDVDEFGRNIIPGKRIDSPDSTRFTKREGVTNGYRVYDGEVVEVSGMTIELSEPFEFVDGEDHYIVFTKENGSNSESILCTQVDEFRVLLQALPVEPIYDGYNKDRTKYILMSEQLRESVALIPVTLEYSINDDGVESNKISSVNYTDKYYKDDLNTPN